MAVLTTVNADLQSTDEETRRRAVLDLATVSLDDARELLFVAMGDGSWRVRKEAVSLLLGMCPDKGTIEGIIGLLASVDNAGLRNSAVEVLEGLAGRAVPALLAHLKDDDRDVRKFVVDILGTIGDRSSIPALIDALDDPDPNVSAAAAENLGKIGDLRAVAPLLAALGKNDVWFSYSILGALARIGEPVPVSVLTPHASDGILKRPVIECLGAVGDAEAVPLLVEGLGDRVRAVREAAACAIIRLRGRLAGAEAARCVDDALARLAGSTVVDGLLGSLDTTDQGVRDALIRVLGYIGDARAALPLLQGCRDERLRRLCLQGLRTMGERGMEALAAAYPAADDEEKSIIIQVWGELGFTGCADLLGEAMGSARTMMRRAAAVAAGKIGLLSLMGTVAALLDDREHDVREGAINGLIRLAPAEPAGVRAIARKLADSSSTGSRHDAVRLYAALGDADRLALLMKDEDPLVRRSAVSALAEQHIPESVSNLVMALVDEDPDVRIAAASGLGEIGGAEAVEPLILSLDDEDPWVRCASLRSLGRIGGERPLDAIERLIDAADGVVMITALETLAEIEGGRAANLVKRGLESGDEEVVKVAIDLLANDGSDWVNTYRERLLSHSHWDVRISFARAMARLLGREAMPHLTAALQQEQDELVRDELQTLLGGLR